MKISMQKTIPVDAKTLKVHIKVRDGFSAELVDAQGETIHNQEDGYVPGFMPGEHYGDYLILDIDIDTGTITNWEKPSAKEIEEWVKSGEE